MPKVQLAGSIAMSKDLYSRLIARGLLDEHGNASEDFFLYVKECLARDSHVLTIGEKTLTSCDIYEAEQIKKRVSNTSGDGKIKVTKPKSDIKDVDATKIDISALSSGVNMLYGGSK